jgi:5-methyltetrahydropteroyltriglutamate--homocysteine methyltransferase
MSANRIRTTHVGSLVRPDEMLEPIRRRLAGELSDGDWDTTLTSAVADVVKKQVEIGVDVVSDGEFGKLGGWEQYVLTRLSGFGEKQQLPPEAVTDLMNDARRFPEFYVEMWREQQASEGVVPCIGEISYVGHDELGRDIANLKAAMSAAGATDGFLPVAAPASAFALSPNTYYPSDEEFIRAGAQALRTEYLTVHEAGLYVQVDDAHLPFQYDVMIPPATRADWEAWARLRVDVLNEALDGIPRDRIRYHICWGSWNGPHTSDVPLNEIVDVLLEVDAGAFCVESANPRHAHEWKVWKDVDLGGRTLIPGVINHQTYVVEHPELVAERLIRFAGVVGAEHLMGGSDCGFGQGELVRRMHPDIQWAKLESLVEGAQIASAELF